MEIYLSKPPWWIFFHIVSEITVTYHILLITFSSYKKHSKAMVTGDGFSLSQLRIILRSTDLEENTL